MSQSNGAARGTWQDLGPAAILLLFSVLGAAVIGSLPSAGQTRFAVIAPPWYGLTDTARLVGNAGGDIVDAGRLPNVIIAQSGDPGFVRAMYRGGAWLVARPDAFGGCLGIPPQASRHPIEG